MESGQLVVSKATEARRSAAAGVVADAARMVRRDWRALLGTLTIIWVAWTLPRFLSGALFFGWLLTPGVPRVVISMLIVVVYLLQALVIVRLMVGLVELHVEGCRTGKRASFGLVFAATTRLRRLFVPALGVALCGAVGTLSISVLGVFAGDDQESNATPKAIALVLLAAVFVTKALVVPLIVDRNRGTLAATRATARLVFGRARERHLRAVALFWLGMLGVGAAFVWPAIPWRFTDADSAWDVLGLLGMESVASAAAAGAIGCLVSVPLITALYRQPMDEAPVVPAPTRVARRPWAPVAALLVSMAVMPALAYSSAWALIGVESDTVPPTGQSVMLANGLSVVPPPQSEPRLIRYVDYPAWLSIGKNAEMSDYFVINPQGIRGSDDRLVFRGPVAGVWTEDGAFLEISSYVSEDASDFHRYCSRYPVIAAAPDGSVTIHGSAKGGRLFFIVTRIPGKQLGGIFVIFASKGNPPVPWTVEVENEALANLWRELDIQGAALPAIH